MTLDTQVRHLELELAKLNNKLTSMSRPVPAAPDGLASKLSSLEAELRAIKAAPVPAKAPDYTARLQRIEGDLLRLTQKLSTMSGIDPATFVNADKVDGLHAATSGADAHVLATQADGKAEASGIKTTNGLEFSGGANDVGTIYTDVNWGALIRGRSGTYADVALQDSNGTVVLTIKNGALNFTGAAGVIQMYGGASAPVGYLLCDGASYVRADYAALFTAIGTTFGTADGTHFNVPDMRGVYPKGAGTTARAAGKDANGNYYAATLGAYTTDRMQGHKHNQRKGAGTIYNPGSIYEAANGGDQADIGPTTVPVTDGTNGTPRTGLTTEPQSLGMNYIIKT